MTLICTYYSFFFVLSSNYTFEYTYTPSQKVDLLRISVFCDIKKIWKKSTILKMSKIFILYNNKAKKLLKGNLNEF